MGGIGQQACADLGVLQHDDAVERGAEGEEIRRHDVVGEASDDLLREADGADPLGPGGERGERGGDQRKDHQETQHYHLLRTG